MGRSGHNLSKVSPGAPGITRVNVEAPLHKAGRQGRGKRSMEGRDEGSDGICEMGGAGCWLSRLCAGTMLVSRTGPTPPGHNGPRWLGLLVVV